MSVMSNFQNCDFFNERLSAEQREAIFALNDVISEYRIASRSGLDALYHEFMNFVYERRDKIGVLSNNEICLLGKVLNYGDDIIEYIVDVLNMFEALENNPSSVIFKKKLEDE